MGTDLEVIEANELAENQVGPIGLFGTSDPQLVIERASEVAKVLKDVIKKQKLVVNIHGKEYIQVEGWTTLGTLVGVFPRVQWTRPMQAADGTVMGWEAAVEVVNNQGTVIGRAEAECMRTEQHWRSRDDYALRSMAQTRAMSKALRMPLGFIAVLAGYEATPADEMPRADTNDAHPSAGLAIEGTKPEILHRLKTELERLKDDPMWSIEKICEAARRHWKKEYTKLEDFTKEELKSVLRAALDS